MNAISAIAYVEAWQMQEFNRVWTRDLAIPELRSINQLSYEATDVGRWSFVTILTIVTIVKLYISYLTSYLIPHGLVRTHKWPTSNFRGFIARLERRTSVARSRVQTPLKAWIFSRLYIRNYLNCVHNCEDHSLLDFKSAVQYMKYFIYKFTCSRFVAKRLRLSKLRVFLA